MEHFDPLLKVGDTVALMDYRDGAAGEIVERLNADYVRVKWADFSTPTIHSNHALSRMDGSWASGQSARGFP
jgi:hypothetical protein